MNKVCSESSIDYPRADLDPAVWQKDAKGRYALRPDARQQIMEYINDYPGELDLYYATDSIHIVGSLATNTYADDSDIDVHIIPNVSRLPESEAEQKALVDDIKKWSKEHPRLIGRHPIELYLQLKPDQDLLGDAAYDVTAGEWLKGPKVEGEGYDPYRTFGGILDQVEEEAREADIDLGELRRDVIDYETIAKAMNMLPGKAKAHLKQQLQAKLAEIEQGIDKLLADKKEWVDARHSASEPTSREQALNDIQLAKKWQDTNAMFKFLDRYQYIETISRIEDVAADGVDDEDIESLKGILGGIR